MRGRPAGSIKPAPHQLLLALRHSESTHEQLLLLLRNNLLVPPRPLPQSLDLAPQSPQLLPFVPTPIFRVSKVVCKRQQPLSIRRLDLVLLRQLSPRLRQLRLERRKERRSHRITTSIAVSAPTPSVPIKQTHSPPPTAAPAPPPTAAAPPPEFPALSRAAFRSLSTTVWWARRPYCSIISA